MTLTWDNGQGLIFRRDDRASTTSTMFTVQGRGREPRHGAPSTLHPYGLVSRHGKPTTLGYYVLHEGLIGVLGDQGLQEYTYDNVDKEAGRSRPDDHAARCGTASAAASSASPTSTGPRPSSPTRRSPTTGSFTMRQDGTDQGLPGRTCSATPRRLQPGATAQITTAASSPAPRRSRPSTPTRAPLGIKNFDLLIDWGWFYFITKPLFKVLDFFYRLFGNFGVAILIVTVLLKIVFFPLANKSYASMAKMKAVQPEMTAIRERYADDKMKQQQALMELYKKEKINPVAGCWPVLIQIPVFFALYKVLFVTIEMRHAPFFGWIRDLAAPDPTTVFNLFGLLPFNPGVGAGDRAVPACSACGRILMGITMWLQMKMNPEPPDPVQKQVFAWMPVIFTFMLASFPAGLVIYWAWNNLLSVTQQYFIMRKNGVKVELWDNLRGTFAKKTTAKAPAKG